MTQLCTTVPECSLFHDRAPTSDEVLNRYSQRTLTHILSSESDRKTWELMQMLITLMLVSSFGFDVRYLKVLPEPSPVTFMMLCELALKTPSSKTESTAFTGNLRVNGTICMANLSLSSLRKCSQPSFGNLQRALIWRMLNSNPNLPLLRPKKLIATAPLPIYTSDFNIKPNNDGSTLVFRNIEKSLCRCRQYEENVVKYIEDH